MGFNDILEGMPKFAQNKVSEVLGNIDFVNEPHNTKTLASMFPSIARGLLLKEGKSGDPVLMKSQHNAYFDFNYEGGFPDLYELYKRAIKNQWDADETLDWSINVDPENPEVDILPDDFFAFDALEAEGIKIHKKDKYKFKHSTISWMLSQFLHGEQGALFAAAQVTESVKWLDGKLYGATQVMDEGRHVEVFLRYLDTKLNKLYQVNDNLFVIIDQVMTDPRWDMKFLGMQIMIEGLALGAFSTIYHSTKEPLLKELLKNVIQDEARHVHFGVLSLRNFILNELNENERKEREDWAYEVSILMKNRFLLHEVYEEWYGGIVSVQKWNRAITNSEGMRRFRNIMFKRLIPNLKFIGLLSPRIMEKYEKAGLIGYENEKNASELTFDELLVS